MIDLRSRYVPWAGSGGAAVLADLADQRLRPYSSRLTNGELVSAGVVLADVFGLGGRYRGYVSGGSDWAIGNLIAAVVRPHLASAVPVPTTAARTTAAGTAVPGVSPNSGAVAYGAGGY